MILKRVEITLVGPDEYPADEGSYADWEALEIAAQDVLAGELEWFLFRIQRKLRHFDPEFELEIEELPRSGASAPSGAPDISPN